MKKFIVIFITAALALAVLCSCSGGSSAGSSSNADRDLSSADKVTDTVNDKSSVSVSSDNSTDSQKATVSSDGEVDFDKITKISAYIADKEIFTEDESIISELHNVLKKAEPNGDPGSATASDGSDYEGFTEIKAYNGDTLVYTFTLSGGDGNKKLHIDEEDTAFYCDISDNDADAFCDVYGKIYDLSGEADSFDE